MVVEIKSSRHLGVGRLVLGAEAVKKNDASATPGLCLNYAAPHVQVQKR